MPYMCLAVLYMYCHACFLLLFYVCLIDDLKAQYVIFNVLKEYCIPKEEEEELVLFVLLCIVFK